MDLFYRRKKDVLSRKDKSSKGKWDKKISGLCEKLNSLNNYYTTSSCSGRIILMVDQDKKEKDLLINVYHSFISFEQLKKDLDEIIRKNKKQIKFKMESCALHVASRTLEDAQILYDKAKLAGWKRSGIISSSSRFMVELTSTEKLEFPIIRNEKVLVSDEFLEIIVNYANEKLKRSWAKIQKLINLI